MRLDLLYHQVARRLGALFRPGRRGSSATALGVLGLRAAHQLIDGKPLILDDPVAVRLMPPAAIRRIARYGAGPRDRRLDGLRSHIVTRSRYAEDRLREAVHRGAQQYVILGAGYDTFAYRQPAWAHDIRVFEVDQPASQKAKRERLQKGGIEVPPNVTFAAVDFEKTSLEAGLAAAGIRSDSVSFFSWLGVLVYLDEAAVDALLRTVATFAPGSEIVLTFSPPDTDGSASALAARAAALGEPWKTRLEPETLLAKLRTAGFSQAELAGPAEIAERYFRDRADGLPPPGRERIAWARV